jgi:dTDP-4-dehydrorhamnose 3,5-epimerase
MIWKEGKIDGVRIGPVKKNVDQRGWLAEIFRADEMPESEMPVMGYISVTKPGVARGPHEHREQTDTFGFIGPGSLRVMLWDNRKTSSTYGTMQTIDVGDVNPVIVMVPPGVVHGYTNILTTDAMVLNFPNRLFAGRGKKQPVDEIRYEDVKDTPFVMNV